MRVRVRVQALGARTNAQPPIRREHANGHDVDFKGLLSLCLLDAAADGANENVGEIREMRVLLNGVIGQVVVELVIVLDWKDGEVELPDLFNVFWADLAKANVLFGPAEKEKKGIT